ncbi:MAG: hypothetical protein LBC76_06215 [Treponema sp.]|jgi:hypothetical protein|nr:hypothetical protein [Treponema sp.]
MDIKKSFEKFDKQNSFIRETVNKDVKGSQKAELNRKGNQLFNSGNIEAAKRIFMTTGYSDGLSRVGDYYKSQNRPLEALRMYWMAPDKTKAQPLIEQVAFLLQGLIAEDNPLSEVSETSEEQEWEQELNNE